MADEATMLYLKEEDIYILNIRHISMVWYKGLHSYQSRTRLFIFYHVYLKSPLARTYLMEAPFSVFFPLEPPFGATTSSEICLTKSMEPC